MTLTTVTDGANVVLTDIQAVWEKDSCRKGIYNNIIKCTSERRQRICDAVVTQLYNRAVEAMDL